MSTPVCAPPARGAASASARAAGRALARLASHRLVQFVAGGALIFAVAAPGPDDTEVALDGARLGALVEKRARLERVAASEALEREVLADVVDDEIMVREARRLGLDRDDAILRRRLVQKVLFLAEDLAGAARPPTDEEVARHFAAHPGRYGAAPLEEAAGVIRLDLAIERRQAAVQAYLADARRRYRVSVDGVAIEAPTGAPRAAVRTAPSVED